MPKRKAKFEIRENPPGELDEVVVHKPTMFHSERMSYSELWIGVDMADGRRVRLWVWAKKGKLLMRADVE